MQAYHKAHKAKVTITQMASPTQLENPCPETKANPGMAYHKGLDSVGPIGSPIYATHDGIVSWAPSWMDEKGGYWLEISRDGRYSAQNAGASCEQYRHLKTGSRTVTQGQKVKAGDKIGLQGNTGYFNGAPVGEHLHYEVYRDGKRMDPYLYATGQEPAPQKILPYNYPSNGPLMITLGAFITEAGAKQALAKLTAYPTAGIMRDTSGKGYGRYMVVACRYEGTLKEGQALADKIAKDIGVAVEMWGW